MSYLRLMGIFVISFAFIHGPAYARRTKRRSKPNKVKIVRVVVKEKKSLDENQVLSDFYHEFKAGSYWKAIDALNKLEEIVSRKSFAHYWKGISYNKLQKFDEAIQAFGLAEAEHANFPDLHYEFGQALYAASELALARAQFEKSVEQNYKVGVSLYYMGFISQSLQEYEVALLHYKKIENINSEDKKDVLQASLYQMGEVYLAQAEVNPEEAQQKVKELAIPQYQMARDSDPKSQLASEINGKIETLQDKYNIIISKMINGRLALRPRYYLKVSEEVKYDSNVILEANAVQNKAQYKGTGISKTEVLGRYGIYPNNKMSFFPEARLNYFYHTDREQSAVYKNDNYSVMPAIRSNYEYTLLKTMATHLIDFDYGYNSRDVYERKEMNFNYRTYTFMLGEKLNFLSLGETILRYRKKYFYSYLELSDSDTNTIALEQMLTFSGGYTLMIVNTNDFSVVRNDQLNTNTYSLRFDFITPRIRDWVTPTFSLGSSLTDPMNMKASRGLEKMINPGLKLTRGFGQIRANLKYDYTRNISKDKSTYDYSKSVYGLEMEYLF